MWERQAGDGRPGGREGVERGEGEGAPNLHHARVTTTHQVLPTTG